MKNVIILFFILIISSTAPAWAQSTTCPVDGSAADLACGMISYWTFDDAAGSQTVADSVGSNTGTLAGVALATPGANSTTTGNNGTGAVNFSSSTSKITTSSDFISTNAVTVCTWFNSTNAAKGEILISNGKFEIGISNSADGTSSKRLSFQNDTTNAIYTTNNVLAPGKWTHVCVTRDTNGALPNIYINGSLIPTGGSIGGPTSSLKSVYIGNNPSSNSALVGEMDDVRVYYRILSASEINALYIAVGGKPILNITLSGKGSGTITSSDGQINCTSSCFASYVINSSVTLTATPSSASDFSGWSGGACSGTGPCTFTMSANTSVTANFVPGLPDTIPVPSSDCQPNVSGTTITACTCSQKDVQNAINLAKDGDTVQVPAGTCTWTQTVTMGNQTKPKSMIIKGAGEGITTIVDDVPTGDQFIMNGNLTSSATLASFLYITTAAGKPFRLTGFTFTGPNGQTTGNIDITSNPNLLTVAVATGFTVNDPITVAGAGASGKALNTVITAINNNVFTLSTAASTSVTAAKISQMSGYNGLININGDSHSFRIDHNDFEIPRGDRVIYVMGYVFGVIDHNKFDEINDQIITVWHNTWGGVPWSDGSWAAPLSLGSDQAVYLEDNNIVNAATVTDGWSGTRFVIRYNTVGNTVDAAFQNHGTESSGRLRGAYSWEFYGNTATVPTQDFVYVRGGTGVIFDNKATMTQKNAIGSLNNYRSSNSFTPWGACDGSSPWDDNDPKTYSSGTLSSTVVMSNYSPIWNPKWTPNQLVGYTITNNNSAKKWSAKITANTAYTVSVDSTTITPPYTPVAPLNYWDAGDSFTIVGPGYTFTNQARSLAVLIKSSDPNSNNPLPWTDNQWAGYSIRNTSQKPSWGTEIITNTSYTLSNTTYHVLIFTPSGYGKVRNWNDGDNFQILKVNHCMDQIGRTESDLLTPDGVSPVDSKTGIAQWPNEKLIPVFAWGNSINGSPNNILGSTESVIQKNREYYYNESGKPPVVTKTTDPKTGIDTYHAQYTDDDTSTKTWTYSPYQCPHNLITSGFTAGGLPTDSVLFPDCGSQIQTLPSNIPGDVNNDQVVTIADAELTAQVAVGLTVSNFNTTAAEVDGKSTVDIYDAFLIAEYVAGLITKFPVQG
jgi:hypothetical protein